MAAQLASQAVDADWLANMLEVLFATFIEGIRGVPANLLKYRSADINLIRIRSMDARGNVDATANQIITVHHHIRKVQTKPHARRVCVALACSGSALQGVDRAGKPHQHRIAHRLEQASIVGGNHVV